MFAWDRDPPIRKPDRQDVRSGEGPHFEEALPILVLAVGEFIRVDDVTRTEVFTCGRMIFFDRVDR